MHLQLQLQNVMNIFWSQTKKSQTFGLSASDCKELIFLPSESSIFSLCCPRLPAAVDDCFFFIYLFFFRRNASKTLNWWNISRIDSTLILFTAGGAAVLHQAGSGVKLQCKPGLNQKKRERAQIYSDLYRDLCGARTLKEFYALFSRYQDFSGEIAAWHNGLISDRLCWKTTIVVKSLVVAQKGVISSRTVRQVQGQPSSQPCDQIRPAIKFWQSEFLDELGRQSHSVMAFRPTTANNQSKYSRRWRKNEDR